MYRDVRSNVPEKQKLCPKIHRVPLQPAWFDRFTTPAHAGYLMRTAVGYKPWGMPSTVDWTIPAWLRYELRGLPDAAAFARPLDRIKLRSKIMGCSDRSQPSFLNALRATRVEYFQAVTNKLLAHSRRCGFDPVAPAFIPIPLAVRASKPIRHPPLLLEMQHAPRACACRLHTGAAGSGLA
jgi:hypothetical protein